MAANRGRFAEANRYVAPSVLRSLKTSQALLSDGRALKLLVTTAGGPQTREKLAHGVAVFRRLFCDPNRCWKAATRNRSLASIEIAREVVAGSTAKVYLVLRLKSGAVEKDAEPVVLRNGKWLIGERGTLHNTRLQPAASSVIMSRRG